MAAVVVLLYIHVEQLLGNAIAVHLSRLFMEMDI